jgi:hypothetical protein
LRSCCGKTPQIKNVGQIFEWDSYARVTDLENDVAFVEVKQDFNPSAFRRVSDGVVNEV